MRMIFLAAALMAMTLSPLAASADFYSYIDRTGAVCMTNSLSAVPPEYRSSMKVVKEEAPAKQAAPMPPRKVTLPESTTLKETATPSEAQPAKLAQDRRLPGKFVTATTLLYSGLAIASFLAIRKLVQQLSSALLARVIYLGFFLGVFVLAYKSYAEHIVGNYFTVKTRILKMYEKANKREDAVMQPAAPAVKDE